MKLQFEVEGTDEEIHTQLVALAQRFAPAQATTASQVVKSDDRPSSRNEREGAEATDSAPSTAALQRWFQSLPAVSQDAVRAIESFESPPTLEQIYSAVTTENPGPGATRTAAGWLGWPGRRAREQGIESPVEKVGDAYRLRPDLIRFLAERHSVENSRPARSRKASTHGWREEAINAVAEAIREIGRDGDVVTGEDIQVWLMEHRVDLLGSGSHDNIDSAASNAVGHFNQAWTMGETSYSGSIERTGKPYRFRLVTR